MIYVNHMYGKSNINEQLQMEKVQWFEDIFK